MRQQIRFWDDEELAVEAPPPLLIFMLQLGELLLALNGALHPGTLLVLHQALALRQLPPPRLDQAPLLNAFKAL